MARARYNFSRLIRSYSHGAVKVTLEGYFDEQGEYLPEGDSYELETGTFAVTALSFNDLQFSPGGMYTDEDRKLHCYKRIPNGSSVEHTDGSGETTKYKVMSERPYHDFDKSQGEGLHIYILRRSDKD